MGRGRKTKKWVCLKGYNEWPCGTGHTQVLTESMSIPGCVAVPKFCRMWIPEASGRKGTRDPCFMRIYTALK
jgi:hypothetical protein